jgi:hypothetical protein
MCSILRHRGVPARLRSGFAPYINIGAPGFMVEHVVVEVWDGGLGRWRLVDPSQSEELMRINDISFDVTDLPPGEFCLPGSVWRDYRAGEIDPDQYGVDPNSHFKGASMIKNRLVTDFHMLNKHELLIWDSTPFMDLHIVPTGEDTSLLDEVAYTCTNHSDDVSRIRELYASEPKLQVPGVLCSYSPYDAPRAIKLK